MQWVYEVFVDRLHLCALMLQVVRRGQEMTLHSLHCLLVLHELLDLCDDVVALFDQSDRMSVDDRKTIVYFITKALQLPLNDVIDLHDDLSLE